MISFSFNLAIVFSSFIIFLLIYYGLLIIKNFKIFNTFDENIDDNPTLIFKQKLSLFLLSLIPIFVLDAIIRIISSTNILPLNIYPFQGALTFTYLFSIFLLLSFAFFNKSSIRKTITSYIILSSPFIYLWVKTNILDGFFPIVSNYFLVYTIKAIWIFVGIICLLIINSKRKKFNFDEPIDTYIFSTSKYLFFFFLGNIIALGTTTMLMDYYYVVSSSISFASLFFVFIMLVSDNNEIHYYEQPYNIIRQKIISRMMLSMAILIVISLELVNYATIFIIQAELKNTKKHYFLSVTEEINKEFQRTYEETYSSLASYFSKFNSSQQLYYIGLTLFNDMPKIKDIEKILVLGKDSTPLLEVTNELVNFNYQTVENTNVYAPYIKEATENGYRFSYNQPYNMMEITKVLKNSKDEIVYYIIAFFNPVSLFTKINQHTFNPDGEILVLDNKYEKLYSTEEAESLRSELHKGSYFEIYTKNAMTGLNILVRQPEKYAFSGIQKAQYNSFFFTIAAILVFLIISFIYMKTIEAPIKKLQKGAKIVGEGDLSYEITIKEKNEFFDLANAFNKMVADLKKMQEEQLKQEQALSIGRMGVALNHEINNPVATITMGAQLANKMLTKLEKEAPKQLGAKITTLQKTTEQIITESKRISKILKDIQEITDPIIEDYVDGTKMVRVKFD